MIVLFEMAINAVHTLFKMYVFQMNGNAFARFGVFGVLFNSALQVFIGDVLNDVAVNV